MEKATKAQLRELRDLVREKKARDEKGLFVSEGIKIVGDMLMKGHVPVSVVVASDFTGKPEGSSLLEKLKAAGVPIVVTGASEIEKVSPLKNSQGILAVMKKPEISEDMEPSRKPLLVVCDGIQDPGNLGAIIRTSIAFGVDGMLLVGDTVDVYNPKVVRASSGTVLDIPVKVSDIPRIQDMRARGYRLLVSTAGGAGTDDVEETGKYGGPLIVAFGSEGKGISSDLSENADGFFHIPIREKIESLNVTAAAAITLFVLSSSKK
jgi:TrmH family RNA methyltransferase